MFGYVAFARNGFLSTPSARRATVRPPRCGKRIRISIHALREEGDTAIEISNSTDKLFLYTPSARRATAGHRSDPQF